MMKRLALLTSALLLAAAPLRADDADDQAVKVLGDYLISRVVRDDKDPAKPVVEVYLGDQPPVFADRPLSYAALKAILALKKLRVLDLGSHVLNVQDNVVATLVGLPELRELNLARTGVTDEGLKALADLPKLQVLKLDGTRVTSVGLKELAKLKGLQTLDLNGGMVTDAGLKEVAQLKGLNALCLGDSNKAFAVDFMTCMRLLKQDPATDSEHIAQGKAYFTSGQLLKEHCFNGKITDAGLKELAGLRELQTLDLIGVQVTDAGLKELAPLKGLQTLNLSDTQITDAGLKEAQLKGLKHLYLTDFTKVGDMRAREGTENLPGSIFEGVFKLVLLEQHHSGEKITDAGLKELAGFTELQTLDLTGAQVTDAGLKELAPLKGLRTLNLSFTQTTDAGLRNLAELKGLKKLNLSFTKVTDTGVDKLRKALPNCGVDAHP